MLSQVISKITQVFTKRPIFGLEQSTQNDIAKYFQTVLEQRMRTEMADLILGSVPGTDLLESVPILYSRG